MKIYPLSYDKSGNIHFYIKENNVLYLRGLFKFETESLIVFKHNIHTLEEAEKVYIALLKYNWFSNVQNCDAKTMKLFKSIKKKFAKQYRDMKNIEKIENDRYKYNQMIVNILAGAVEQYPYMRFGQILVNLNIIKEDDKGYIHDPFYDESVDMFNSIRK